MTYVAVAAFPSSSAAPHYTISRRKPGLIKSNLIYFMDFCIIDSINVSFKRHQHSHVYLTGVTTNPGTSAMPT